MYGRIGVKVWLYTGEVLHNSNKPRNERSDRPRRDNRENRAPRAPRNNAAPRKEKEGGAR